MDWSPLLRCMKCYPELADIYAQEYRREERGQMDMKCKRYSLWQSYASVYTCMRLSCTSCISRAFGSTVYILFLYTFIYKSAKGGQVYMKLMKWAVVSKTCAIINLFAIKITLDSWLFLQQGGFCWRHFQNHVSFHIRKYKYVISTSRLYFFKGFVCVYKYIHVSAWK